MRLLTGVPAQLCIGRRVFASNAQYVFLSCLIRPESRITILFPSDMSYSVLYSLRNGRLKASKGSLPSKPSCTVSIRYGIHCFRKRNCKSHVRGQKTTRGPLSKLTRNLPFHSGRCFSDFLQLSNFEQNIE